MIDSPTRPTLSPSVRPSSLACSTTSAHPERSARARLSGCRDADPPAPPSCTHPSSSTPASQLSSMPLQTSIAAGWTLGSESSQIILAALTRTEAGEAVTVGINGQPFVDVAIAVVVDAVADLGSSGIDAGIEVIAIRGDPSWA